MTVYVGELDDYLDVTDTILAAELGSEVDRVSLAADSLLQPKETT